MRVSGSVARGEARQGSGIDILIDLEPGRNPLDHVGVKQDPEELLGVKVDVVAPRGLHPLIRDRVLAEAVAV